MTAAVTTYRAAIAEASSPCDMSAVWEASVATVPCSLVMNRPLFFSGALDYVKPGALDGLESRGAVFGPSQYHYREGVNTLPVVVLVDENTASASEYFAEVLRDNHAGLIVGSLTVGAGCGSMLDRQLNVTLRHSGGRLHVPDCVRLRPDDSNEVSGLTPDVLLPLARRDSAFQRATKVRAGLELAAKRLRLTP